MKVQRNDHNVKSIRKKLNVLWLTSIIKSAKEIAEIAGVSIRTVFDFINLYNKYGLDAVMELNYRKPQSDLMGYAELITAEFESKPPRSIKEARGIIKKITGIKRSLTQIRVFLYKLGMKVLKPIKVPMGTNETSIEEKTANQKEFVEDKLNPLLIEAKEGKRKLLFMDACHMQLACVVGFIWCFVTKYIPALPIRGRVNVLGAVSPYGNDLVYEITQDSIDQYSIAFFLLKVRNKFKEDKITLVLDNAPYHKTNHVKETAEKLGIELLFLPVASPNLNIIERLWKLIKKMFLHNEVLTSLDELEKYLKNSMKTLKKKHKKEMRTLLTTNFQYFDGTVQFVTA